jgi:uncharacterized membrane protein
MSLFIPLVEQLLSYHWVTWLCWIAFVFGVARLGGCLAVLFCPLLIAVSIVYLDVNWVIHEMKRPNVDDENRPDMDIVFVFGIVIRVALINIVLSPVAWLGIHFHPSRSEPQASPP